MKAIENAIYCKFCVGKLSRRTPEEFVLRYPASHAKSICHGAEVEIMESEMPDSGFIMQKHLGYQCTKCLESCEIEVNKGTCRGCGNEIALRGASKVVRRKM